MPYFALRRGAQSSPFSAPSTEPEKTVVSPPPAANSNGLPLPVTQGSITSEKKGKPKKSARMDRNLRVHWERFRRRLGTGTAPSTSSALEPDESGDGSSYPRSRTGGATQMDDVPDEAVDEVVVDREWSDEIKSSSITHSEHGGTPDKGSNAFGTGTDRESFAIQANGFWGLCTPLVVLRWRVWPFMYSFFCTRFLDEKSEAHYNKENWFLRKNLALWSAAFFVANWTFGIAFVASPLVLADRIFYYGVSVAFTFPLLPLIMYDFPRDRTWSYQTYLVFAIWIWPTYQLLFMYLCGYYTSDDWQFTCGNKDFLTTFYYSSALQTVGLFGLKLHRFAAMLGAITFFLLTSILIAPLHLTFVRNIVNFVLFQAFLLYIHYMRENAERRLYTLRDQLKIQFRATQKAQVNERKAADSKRRLTSYVFHEVRVPLNTALLAVQNMDASGSVAKSQEIEFNALEGSLSMMSKVLNDVLDFNRMDSGRFESVLKPYNFHQVLRSMFVPLQLATDARNLEFITDLDKNIDEVARRALEEALGEADPAVRLRLSGLSEDGIVVGDETRLRQIVTNLASNACKFTPSGGKLTIRTRLMLPSLPLDDTAPLSETAVETPSNKEAADVELGAPEGSVGSADLSHSDCGEQKDDIPQRLSATHLVQHNLIHNKTPPLEWIVVRIEVTDTGYGIRPKDMVQSKLFSAFNQTEQGRLQGGKGTGLGLALVRQIVKLSGGRLGVQSKVGEGSTFWVELPLGVGSKALPALITPSDDDNGFSFPMPGSRSNSGKTVTMADDPDRKAMQDINASRSSSAFQTIMDQAGLVEISTRPRERNSVLTRMIGDPSTGTHAVISEDFAMGHPIEPPETIACPPDPTLGSDPVRLYLSQLPKHPHTFPPQDAPISPAPSAGSSSLPANTPTTHRDGPLRVLVVDDDPLTRKLMSRMLTRIGCKVATADNGEVALEMILGTGQRATPSSEDTGSAGLSLDGPEGADEYRYAVVFLDNQMPVLSGLNAVAKLRELGRTDFVVGVTGNALLSDQQEYLEAGADYVLTKPVLEKSLKSMLVIADERRKRVSQSPTNPSAPDGQRLPRTQEEAPDS